MTTNGRRNGTRRRRGGSASQLEFRELGQLVPSARPSTASSRPVSRRRNRRRRRRPARARAKEGAEAGRRKCCLSCTGGLGLLQRRARPNNHLPVDANSVGLSIKYHNRLNLPTSGGGMLYARTHLLSADLRSVSRRLFASTPGGPHRKRTSSAVNNRAFAAPMFLMIRNTRSCGVRL